MPGYFLPFVHISGQLERTGDWRRASVTPIYKKGCNEDPGNYRLVSLTSVPGKVMEQIVLRKITRHVQLGDQA